MKHTSPLKPTAALLLVAALWAPAGCTTPGRSGVGAPMVTIPVYRGVGRNGNGRAQLSPSQFRFNNDLSTFGAPTNSPCNYQFDITGIPANPAQPGDSGPVSGLPGYVATFDDVPPGHWSIARPVGTSTTAARQAVSVYAQANRGFVVAGAQACN
jgi:hypothetical protein